MSDNFADRLLSAIAAKGSPVCVGLDPTLDRLPEAVTSHARGPAAVEAFCMGLIEAVAPIVPAVKPQSAYFEALGPEGVAVYFRVVAAAKKAGLIVIGDVKRNDIGSTAEAYAAGHLAGPDSADAVTVNGYLGADGIEPFVKVARETGRGLFVLVRTSNPSAAAIQDFTAADGRKLYEHVAAQVAAIGAGEGLVGASGYSCVGAVVGATWPAQARELRAMMPQQIVLVPGYGAQGASAADCAASFKPDRTGALVNASRSVIFAHTRKEYAGLEWRQAVAAAARGFASDISGALP
ncbi:MAG: orotidine-5'-phosphate decarboxylase [Planctomycetota bacterium]|nr:orotidine-5'-phosphate decarboxylase [Planctomycetota bacterium]